MQGNEFIYNSTNKINMNKNIKKLKNTNDKLYKSIVEYIVNNSLNCYTDKFFNQ